MKRSISFILAALVIAACSKPEQAPAWSKIDLPAAGPVVLSGLADCGGRWWAVGGISSPDGSTRPAAWTGEPWAPVPFAARPESYYGPRQVIRSVACAGNEVVMVGATPGGAHGNPRVSTWRLENGRMVENAAPFETYGGDEAVDVGPIAAGPEGFAIAGNRSSGAAAWFSRDGKSFTLSESKEAGTAARDVVALPDGRWLVAGSRTWTVAPWRAGAAPEGEIQRVIRDGDDLVAAGVSGDGFAIWRWHQGEWQDTGRFAGDPHGVRAIAVFDGQSVIASGGLWIGGHRRDTPAEPVAVAARGGTLLMATTDSLWQTG